MRDKKVMKRMEANQEGNSFIAIKDHKENFDNHPTVRLTNHAKIELGRNKFKQIKYKNLYKFATYFYPNFIRLLKNVY